MKKRSTKSSTLQKNCELFMKRNKSNDDEKEIFITKNIYLCKPPVEKKIKVICFCRDRCANNCLNKDDLMFCGRGTCAYKTWCNNRFDKQLFYEKFLAKKFINNEKGFGVITTKKIEPKKFIVEYVGEITSSGENNARYSAMPDMNKHFYVMDYGVDGFFIDATKKYNISRYINHSCDPNFIC